MTPRPRLRRAPLGSVVAMLVALLPAAPEAQVPADGHAGCRSTVVALAEGTSPRPLSPQETERRRYATYDQSDLQRARRAIASMRRADPSLKLLFDEAVGYAVFPELGAGEGAGGVGVLFEDGQAAGRAVIPTWPADHRSGVLPSSTVIFFASRYAVATFKHGGLDMGAQARSVAVVSGKTTTVHFVSGVSVLTLGGSGATTDHTGAVVFGYLPYLREIATTSREP
jgi:hypothetical protein